MKRARTASLSGLKTVVQTSATAVEWFKCIRSFDLGNRDTPRQAMDVNVARNGTGVGVGTAVIARHDPLSIYLA